MSQLLGVDVSSHLIMSIFLNEDGVTLADFSVSNDQNGANTLIKSML